jgi:MFS transporter, UMF1 family
VGETGRPPARATAAWILYDLANTVFSFSIVSTFFPLWLHDDLGLPDAVFAIGNSVSMAIVLVTAPGLGMLSDRARRRVPFLIGSTIACVVPTMFLGVGPWPAAITLFVLANAAFQAGLIFYDSLLPFVSTPANRGRVGAWGVGLGYGGSFLGLGVGRAILAGHEERDPWVFAAAGALFLLISLPAFLLIREPGRGLGGLDVRAAAQAVRASFTGLARLLRGSDVPHIRRFLLGRIFYADAANTMILFMGLYATQEAGFSQAGVAPVLAVGILGALTIAPLWGLLVDRIGPRHTLTLVLFTWMFNLTIVALVPVLDLDRAVFYPLAFLLGASLGGTWSADRPLLLALAPPDRLGEFYGLYAMMGRFAAIFGPLVWALVVDALGWGRPAAVLSLLVFMVVAYVILRRLPDPRRPGPTPLAPFLPWRTREGHALPLPRRWGWRFPAHALYLASTTAVFVAFVRLYGGRAENAPPIFDTLFVYHIPQLFTNVPLTLLHFVTGVWVNWHIVQLVYVWVLLLLFGVWFEVREGTRRAVLVFYASSIAAGVLAGALLHVLRQVGDAPWIDAAWTGGWTGGSAGAFGLMGAVAARARRPWLLLGLFAAWELNVAYWWLKSYTPAFHLIAMATGFVLARFVLRPRPAAS